MTWDTAGIVAVITAASAAIVAVIVALRKKYKK